MEIKQIGYQKAVLVFASAKEAKGAQDDTGAFSSDVLEKISQFSKTKGETRYGDIYSSRNIRDNFDSFRVGKKIFVW